MKEVKCFPFTKKKKKIYFFLVNTKNISSPVLKISAISLVLYSEITDIFNTFDEVYQTSKYPLCIIHI